MIDVKILKKPKNEGSTSALNTSGTAYGGMAVKEAAHAARADMAELAKEATHAKESDHAAEADHSQEADHATAADEAKHALEADHAKEADNADKWDGREFADYLGQPVRTTDAVAFDQVTTDMVVGSGKFVDGLLGSNFRLWKDERGLAYLTVDKLTVRQTMSVMELLINKVRSVGGQICVSAANGKIKTVEKLDGFYIITFEEENMFVAHDLMRCQTFTGNDMRGYWVEVTNATKDSITVAAEEFGSVEPKVGDECVLMGNTENADRQNLVLISATEDGQPRVDVMDGVKDKTFDGALRARLGNLKGINDDRFPANRQPRGNGLYADNAYLKGTFLLETGEDVKTRFEVTEGKIESAVEGLRQDFASDRGYLNNPSFADGMDKWATENETVFFLVGNRWVWTNGKALAKKGDSASVTKDMGRTVVRIRNKYIRQSHANLQSVPKMAVNAEGKKTAQPVYLAFFYRCAQAGRLKVEFENVDKTGFEDFNSMSVEEDLTETDGYTQYTCSGLWNGTGDFKLSFTGDIYLYMLILSTDKVESLAYKYKTLFEQSEKLVRIAAENFDKDGRVLEGSEIITTSKYNTLMSERFNEDGTLKNRAGLVTTTDWEAWQEQYGEDMDKKMDIEAFAGMFASAVEENTNIVKKADVSAFVKKDGNGRLESGVHIGADQITLEGVVTANGNFKILEDGSMEAISGKIGKGENAFIINESGLSYGNISSWGLDSTHKMLFTPEFLRIQNQDAEQSGSFHRIAFGNNADPSVEEKFGTVAFIHRNDVSSNYWKAFNPAMRIYSMTAWGHGVALQTNGAIIAHDGPIAEKGFMLTTTDSVVSLNKLSAMNGSVFIVKNSIDGVIVYLPEYTDIRYMFKDTNGTDNNVYSVKIISHKDNEIFKVRVGISDSSDTKILKRMSEVTEFAVYAGDIMEFILVKIGTAKYWQAITHYSYTHD